MRTSTIKWTVLVTGVLLSANGQSLPNLFPLPDPTGLIQTNNSGGGPIQETGPFFNPSVATDEVARPATGPRRVGAFRPLKYNCGFC